MALKLEDVSGIGKTTADRLRSAGIDTVEKLAAIDLKELLKIKSISETKESHI